MKSDPEVVRVALYGRVSCRDKGQDTENQFAQLREFASRRGWRVVAEYRDQASGSSIDGRAEFKQMFQDAARRRFDLCLFWALDRFTREGTLATLQYLQQLDSYGVGWRSFTEQYLDSTGLFRDAVISILATIAKQERVRISERVKAGLARVRAKGTRVGRPRRQINLDRVAELRGAGYSWRRIGREIGADSTLICRAYRSKNLEK